MRNSTFLAFVFLCLSCSLSPFGCGEGDFKYTITVENNTFTDLPFTIFSAQYQKCDVSWTYQELMSPANSTSEFKLKVVKPEKASSDGGNVEIRFSSSANNAEAVYPPGAVDFFFNRYSVRRKDNLHLIFNEEDCESRNKEIILTTINSSDTLIEPTYRTQTSKFTGCRPSEAPRCRYTCFGGSLTTLSLPSGSDSTFTARSSIIQLEKWTVGDSTLKPETIELSLVWKSSEPLPDTIFVEFSSFDEFEVRDSR